MLQSGGACPTSRDDLSILPEAIGGCNHCDVLALELLERVLALTPIVHIESTAGLAFACSKIRILV